MNADPRSGGENRVSERNGWQSSVAILRPARAELPRLTRPAPHLSDLFDFTVYAFELCAPVSTDALLPEERPFVAGAAKTRALQFAGGRACARGALQSLGVPAASLLPGRDKVPIWPGGTLGSITHTETYCGAVACRRNHCLGIGVDAENRDGVTTEIETLICTPNERAWLDRTEPDRRSTLATVIFSAKESFYKAQYCLTGAWLDFQDVEVLVDEKEQSVVAQVLRRLPALDDWRGALRGRFACLGDHVFTGFAV